MALLFLEALGALALLLFIVWWTMFAGRKNGELPDESSHDAGKTGDTGPDNTDAQDGSPKG